MTLRCDCGDTLADWRGARGHVQFTAGDGHGAKQEVPDGWKSMFTDLDDADGDEDGGDDADDGGDDGPRDTDDDAVDAHTDDAGGSHDGRVRRFLYEDVRAIYGGDR